jgi:hypothetical protein
VTTFTKSSFKASVFCSSAIVYQFPSLELKLAIPEDDYKNIHEISKHAE